MASDKDVIDADFKEVKAKREVSSLAVLSYLWLALMVFGGVRNDGDLWYLNAIVFGFPAIAFLLIRFLTTGLLRP